MTTCCRLDLSYVPAIQIREASQMPSRAGAAIPMIYN